MNDAGEIDGAGLTKDAALVNKTAAELLSRLGDELPKFLREQIEVAEGNSDELSVRVWKDIRAAAEKLGLSQKF